MCVVSNTGDFFGQRIPREYPWVTPSNPGTWTHPFIVPAPPSKEELDKLKREVDLMKELLVSAKKYDQDNNEPECEIDEKIEKLKAIASIVGISLDDVFVSKRPAVRGVITDRQRISDLEKVIDNLNKDMDQANNKILELEIENTNMR
jgi:hypothetical protein